MKLRVQTFAYIFENPRKSEPINNTQKWKVWSHRLLKCQKAIGLVQEEDVVVDWITCGKPLIIRQVDVIFKLCLHSFTFLLLGF